MFLLPLATLSSSSVFPVLLHVVVVPRFNLVPVEGKGQILILDRPVLL